MNPSLIIFKRKTRLTKNKLYFAVVDYDKSKTYPSNFICQLPNYRSIYDFQNKYVFSKLFKNKEKEIAKKLLTEALEKDQEPEIEMVIERRLKNLNRKKPLKNKLSN